MGLTKEQYKHLSDLWFEADTYEEGIDVLFAEFQKFRPEPFQDLLTAKAFELTAQETSAVEIARSSLAAGYNVKSRHVEHLVGAIDRALATLGPTDAQVKAGPKPSPVSPLEALLQRWERAGSASTALEVREALAAEKAGKK